MLLKLIKTSEYRSLYKFCLELQPFTVLIGRNDAGKSNVMRAIELLLNDEATKKASKYDWSKVDRTKRSSRFPREINIIGTLDEVNPITIRRRIKVWKNKDQESLSNLEIYSNGNWHLTNAQELKLPVLYYLHPRTGALQEAFDPTKEHNIFSLVKDWMPKSLKDEYSLDKLMRAYSPSSPGAMSSYIEFFENNVYGPLNLAFPPDFPLIRFDIKFRGKDDNNLLIVRELSHMRQSSAYFNLPLDHHGSALISITAMILSIAVLQEYHKQNFPGRSIVIALEEPEVHLHPGAQRIFLRYLKWVSQTTQILITTHSPVLVDRAEPKNVVVLRRTTLHDEKVAKAQGIDRKIGATTAIPCDYRTNWRGVIDSLGVKLSDALMVGEVNLLVEGPTEAILLPAMIKRLADQGQLQLDTDRIFILHGEGGNLPNLASLLRQTGNPIVVMLDNDGGGNKMKETLIAQGLAIEDIFTPAIGSLMSPSNMLPECEFEDLLDANILLDAFNDAFANILGNSIIPLENHEFHREQSRLAGRREDFGWIATINSLIDQKTASKETSKKKSKKERFSKRILAETAAEYVLDGRLPIPMHCQNVLKKIDELLKINS